MIDWLVSLEVAPTFQAKAPAIQKLIIEAVGLLDTFTIPLPATPRRLERMALAFLAVANIKQSGGWHNVQIYAGQHTLTTRQLIEYVNEHFGETISLGSYDDIRRQDLKFLVADGIVLPTNPDAARNNPTRAYMLNPDYALVIASYKTPAWENALERFKEQRVSLTEKLAAKRLLEHTKVTLPSGIIASLSPGEHNYLQKMILEQFLPRFGYRAEVLYLGDTADKFLLVDRDKLQQLHFPELGHGELPDIIAYSPQKNWLYLIEAVHTSGAISPLRLLTLKDMVKDCPARPVFVTTFLDRKTFRKFVADIAWETEVWIAAEPDHLIHFNGEKFLHLE